MYEDVTDINLEGSESEEAKQLLEDILAWKKDPKNDEEYILLPLNVYLDDDDDGLDRWINLNFNFKKASFDQFRPIKRLFEGLGECIPRRPNIQNLPVCKNSNSQVLRYAIILNQTKEETEKKRWKYSLWTIEFLRKIRKSCQRLLNSEFHPDKYPYVSSNGENETVDKKEDKDVVIVTEEDGNKFKQKSATQWTKCFNTVRDTLTMCMEIMEKHKNDKAALVLLSSSSSSTPTFSSSLMAAKCSNITTIHDDDDDTNDTLSSLSSSSSPLTSSSSLLCRNAPYYSAITNAIAEGKHMQVHDNGFRLEPLKHVLAAFYTTFPAPLQEAFRRCSWQPTSRTWLDDTTPLDFIETQIGLQNSSSLPSFSSSCSSSLINSNKKIDEIKTMSSSSSSTTTITMLASSLVTSRNSSTVIDTSVISSTVSIDTTSHEERKSKKRKQIRANNHSSSSTKKGKFEQPRTIDPHIDEKVRQIIQSLYEWLEKDTRPRKKPKSKNKGAKGTLSCVKKRSTNEFEWSEEQGFTLTCVDCGIQQPIMQFKKASRNLGRRTECYICEWMHRRALDTPTNYPQTKQFLLNSPGIFTSKGIKITFI